MWGIVTNDKFALLTDYLVLISSLNSHGTILKKSPDKVFQNQLVSFE